jgi:hypothetical protein
VYAIMDRPMEKEKQEVGKWENTIGKYHQIKE